ncbi:MAG: cytochrome c [Bacteroidota bacterium]
MKVKVKRMMFWSLIVLFIMHSSLVFTTGTETDRGAALLSEDAVRGKLLFQEYNCIACHQIYGLGGYMGPDLTNVISAPGKGREYARAYLLSGTQRMPRFPLKPEEIGRLLAYLEYVDQTGVSPVRQFKINPYGTVITPDGR